MSMTINKELPNPAALKAEFPVPEHIKEIKAARDKEIAAVFRGESDKFLVIVGPCSADNEESVCEYTRRLARVNEQVKDRLILIPRIYTNKPRTTGEGYKGMLHQPDPDKAPDLLGGIIAIRKMHMRAIEETGLTCADEMLYPENRSYLDDLLSYEAIGARSVENQQHRLTASSMDIPAGMKNPTSGDLSVMMNSIKAAQSAHNFIYRGCDVTTTGNPLAHAILRGGVDKYGTTIPNYHYEDLKRLASLYEESGLENPACVVDVNHSNSGKKFKEQIRIVSEVLHSRSYDPAIHKLVKGVMIRQQCATPIAMGELFNNPHEWRHLVQEHLIDYIRVHISQIGGITPARKLIALCDAYGVRTAWHGPVDMTPIGHAVNLHMDISSPNFGVQEWADSFTGLYAQLNGQLMTEMFPGMPQRRDGYLYLSDRPGIGVDFDEKLAAKYPCKPGAVSWDWMLARLPDGTSVRP